MWHWSTMRQLHLCWSSCVIIDSDVHWPEKASEHHNTLIHCAWEEEVVGNEPNCTTMNPYAAQRGGLSVCSTTLKWLKPCLDPLQQLVHAGETLEGVHASTCTSFTITTSQPFGLTSEILRWIACHCQLIFRESVWQQNKLEPFKILWKEIYSSFGAENRVHTRVTNLLFSY